MEVQSLEERQTPSSPGRERSLKRPRVDEDQEDGDEVPTEDCDKHPTLYLEDGNVVLRCEDTLFRFYIGVLSRKSEIFEDMFGLAPLQPADCEKTVDGLPVVRLFDSAADFAYLLSALLDYESLFLQKYIQYPRFSALLRLSMKYEMEGIRKILIHRIQKHYPVRMSDYEQIMKEPGTAAAAAFTLSPHPNEVLKLFWECDVQHCLPVAFYEATVRGVNSLSSSSPNVSLPSQILPRAVKALGSCNSKVADHVRSALEPVRNCRKCASRSFVGVEHALLPIKVDLSVSPLRDPHSKPEIIAALCETCAAEFLSEDRAFKCAFWSELPEMFGLSTWTELSKLVVLK